jgi:hypothetical protein
MDPGAKLQRPQPQQREFRGNSPRSSELRGVGMVHRRPDGRSSSGASRGAKQGGWGLRFGPHGYSGLLWLRLCEGVRLHGHTFPFPLPLPLSLFPTPAQAHSHGLKAAAARWRCLSFLRPCRRRPVFINHSPQQAQHPCVFGAAPSSTPPSTSA